MSGKTEIDEIVQQIDNVMKEIEPSEPELRALLSKLGMDGRSKILVLVEKLRKWPETMADAEGRAYAQQRLSDLELRLNGILP